MSASSINGHKFITIQPTNPIILKKSSKMRSPFVTPPKDARRISLGEKENEISVTSQVASTHIPTVAAAQNNFKKSGPKIYPLAHSRARAPANKVTKTTGPVLKQNNLRVPPKKISQHPMPQKKHGAATKPHIATRQNKPGISSSKPNQTKTTSPVLTQLATLKNDVMARLECSSISNKKEHLEKIRNICEGKYGPSAKLEELATLSFYLARLKASSDRIPVDKTSYLAMRARELVAKAQEYKQADVLKIKNVATGAPGYLLRALVRMVIQPNGSFQIGGCYAVRTLLQKTEVATFFTKQEIDQMLSLMNHLIKDKDFRDLFLEPIIKVPEIIEKIIRTHLKIKKNVELSLLEAQWSILISLSSLMGQITEGNCFAIAPYNVVLRQHATEILRLAREIIRDGAVSFIGHPAKVPVEMIMESYLCFEKLFTNKLPATTEKKKEPLPVRVAKSATGKEEVPFDVAEKNLKTATEKTFGSDARSAQEIISSFSQDLLQQTIFAAFQCRITNSSELIYSSPAMGPRLITKIHEFLFERSYKPSGVHHAQPAKAKWELLGTEYDEFLDELKKNISRAFLLITNKNESLQFNDEKVIFPFHSQGLWLDKNKNAQKEYHSFQYVRRVIFFDEILKKYVPVDQISEFGKLYIDIIANIFEKRQREGKCQGPVWKEEQDELIAFFSDPQFIKVGAHALFELNQLDTKENTQLTPEIFEKNDSLFIAKEGGQGIYGTRLPKIKAYYASSKYIIIESQNGREFLCNCLDTIQTQVAKSSEIYKNSENPFILATFETHDFTFLLSPSRYLWETSTQERTNKIISFERWGKERLEKECDKTAEESIVDELLKKVTDRETQRKLNAFKNRFVRNQQGNRRRQQITLSELTALTQVSTMETFRNSILPMLSPSEKEQFELIFNAFMSHEKIEDFKQALSPNSELYAKLKLTYDANVYQKICEELDLTQKKRLSPYEMATSLKTALLKQNIRSLQQDELERLIAEHYKIPPFTDLALMNWNSERTENRSWVNMGVGYNYIDENLKIYSRTDGTIDTLDTETVSLMLKRLFLLFENPAKT